MTPFLRTCFALCYLATLCSASTHTCNDADACPATITCTSGEPCLVICSGDLSCLSRVIDCPSNRACDVQCISPTSRRLCSEMTINAQDSRSLTLNVLASTDDPSVTKTMQNAKIHCPSNGPFSTDLGASCHINCFGDDLMAKTEIYAADGFDDVTITAKHSSTECNSQGVMHCGNDFESFCAMTNDMAFQCHADAADKTCDSATSASSISTASPTPPPTLRSTRTPTLLRTAEPSAHPTASPTRRLMPTATMGPTSSPTHSDTSDAVYDVTKFETATLNPISSTLPAHYGHSEPRSEKDGVLEQQVELEVVVLTVLELGIIGVSFVCLVAVCVGCCIWRRRDVEPEESAQKPTLTQTQLSLDIVAKMNSIEYGAPQQGDTLEEGDESDDSTGTAVLTSTDVLRERMASPTTRFEAVRSYVGANAFVSYKQSIPEESVTADVDEEETAELKLYTNRERARRDGMCRIDEYESGRSSCSDDHSHHTEFPVEQSVLNESDQ